MIRKVLRGRLLIPAQFIQRIRRHFFQPVQTEMMRNRIEQRLWTFNVGICLRRIHEPYKRILRDVLRINGAMRFPIAEFINLVIVQRNDLFHALRLSCAFITVRHFLPPHLVRQCSDQKCAIYFEVERNRRTGITSCPPVLLFGFWRVAPEDEDPGSGQRKDPSTDYGKPRRT